MADANKAWSSGDRSAVNRSFAVSHGSVGIDIDVVMVFICMCYLVSVVIECGL